MLENEMDLKDGGEFLSKKNHGFFSEPVDEPSIYSFGGVLLDESNQKITDDLIGLYTGTTANVVLLRKHHFYIANVGDSLAVLFKDGKAIRLNEEHKLTIPGEKNRVTNSGLKISNNRIEGKLNLTRAIGDFMFKSNKNLKRHDQAVTAFPEVAKHKITSDMEFIIMGCDGVWDCVDPQQVCEYISMKLKERTPISNVISELFDQILAKNNKTNIGTDNMSCLIVQLKQY